MVTFYTPWKHQKTSGFIFPGGIKRKQWCNMSKFIEAPYFFCLTNIFAAFFRWSDASWCFSSSWKTNKLSTIFINYFRKFSGKYLFKVNIIDTKKTSMIFFLLFILDKYFFPTLTGKSHQNKLFILRKRTALFWRMQEAVQHKFS